MKEKILSMLSCGGEFVSGQALCESLHVSRTAVWKVINQLREEGYEIESVPSKGYRIVKRPDRITAEEIASRLQTKWAARTVYYYETIGSTNNEAKRLAEQGAPAGTLVVAEEQVQGKGRRGRTWITPAGTAIAMSLLLRPGLPGQDLEHINTEYATGRGTGMPAERQTGDGCISMEPGVSEAQSGASVRGCFLEERFDTQKDKSRLTDDTDVVLHPDRAPMLTLVMGMAVAAACRETLGVDVGIKWPNDVVAQGKKICGILTEMSCEVDYINYVVIGIGINTSVEEFPPELRETAISLHMLTGCRPDRAKLIAACMEKFEKYYGLFMRTQDYTNLMDEYNAILVGKGGKVRVFSPGAEFEGISEGINAEGELMVRREDGTLEQIFAGEVSVRGIYGYV